MAKVFVKVDKNGSKVFHDDTCTRCDGKGYTAFNRVHNGICFKCHGTKIQKTRIVKEHTPEYQKSLDRKKEIKRLEKIAKIENQPATPSQKEYIKKLLFYKNPNDKSNDILNISGDNLEHLTKGNANELIEQLRIYSKNK